MSKIKNTSSANLDEILGGGSMKDLINGVSGVNPVVSKDNTEESETGLEEGNVEIGNLEGHLNYYLRTGFKKQAVYVDVELIKELEKLIYKLKYSGGVRSIPKSSLVCAIIKSFIEENKKLLE